MNPVRDLRRHVGMTQAQLATAAGTSQPTIAAYENGSKSPTLHTLKRIARSVGRDAVVSFVPALTREDLRSLAVHRAIADRLVEAPGEVLRQAHDNLAFMSELHPHASSLLREWADLLSLPIDELIEAMLDPSLRGRDLRQVTPFAGVLTAAERTKVYQEFAARGGAA
jgi:transcriptional regulator with XRE-family HTH domain